MEHELKRVKNARLFLITSSKEARGHATTIRIMPKDASRITAYGLVVGAQLIKQYPLWHLLSIVPAAPHIVVGAANRFANAYAVASLENLRHRRQPRPPFTKLVKAISPIDGSLVRGFTRGGVHEVIASPASEIAPTEYPAAVAHISGTWDAWWSYLGRVLGRQGSTFQMEISARAEVARSG